MWQSPVFLLVLSTLFLYGVRGARDARLDGAIRSDVSSFRSLKSTVMSNEDGEFPSDQMRVLGGEATSTPCCVSSEPGRVDCFVRGPNSTVLQMTKSGETYSEWVDIGGLGIGFVECFSRSEGVIELMGQSEINELAWAAYSGSEWTFWTSLKGTIIREAPSCIVRSDGTVACNTRYKNGQALNTDSGSVGSWTAPELIEWEFQFPITCLRRSDGYTCYAASLRNRLVTFWSNRDGTWGGGGLMLYGMKCKPSVCGWNNGYRAEVFVLGLQNQLKRIYTEGYGNWQPAEDLGGKFESTPQCVSNDVDTIDCIGVGIDSKLYRKTFKDGEWSEWIPGWDGFKGGIFCLRTSSEEISCYARNLESDVVEVVYASK